MINIHIKNISIFLFSICLVACAGPIHKQQPHAYVGVKRPLSELAIIYGNNNGDRLDVHLNILAVDDFGTREGGRGARKAYVTQGKHVIYIGVLIGDCFTAGIQVSRAFKAKHIYQLRHKLTEGSEDCNSVVLWFEDMGKDYIPPHSIFPRK